MGAGRPVADAASARSVRRGGGQHARPVPDGPLVTQPLVPHGEQGTDRLPDGLAASRVDLGGEERRVLPHRAPDLAGLGVRGQPRGQDPAGRQAADDGGPADDQVEEADQVVAHVVQGVTARRPGGPALAAEVDGVDVEVLGQQRHGRLVAPPRLRLPGDQQQRRELGLARGAVVDPYLAEVGERLRERVRHEGVRPVSGLQPDPVRRRQRELLSAINDGKLMA